MYVMYCSQLPPATRKAVFDLIDKNQVLNIHNIEQVDHWCGSKSVNEWIRYCHLFSLYDNNEEVARELLELFLEWSGWVKYEAR